MMAEKLIDFDAADYLDSDEAIAEYLTAIIDEGDQDLFIKALGDVAKARGMAQIARDAGLGRESLYKALRPGANPRFDTVMKVMKALRLKILASASEGMPHPEKTSSAERAAVAGQARNGRA